MARAIALSQLTVRARTRAELAGKLAARNVPAETADTVLDRFEEVGLIDDASFARQWVQSRHSGRQISTRRLRQELRTKGVSDEDSAEALGEVTPEAERDVALQLAGRKLPTLERLEPEVRYRRLAGILARRGFGPGIVTGVLAEVLGRRDEPGSV